jgi:hypothetical protein
MHCERPSENSASIAPLAKWRGPGSKRRPSAFQAEFGPTPMCFSRSDQTRDRHSDVLDQSVWLVGPILAP